MPLSTKKASKRKASMERSKKASKKQKSIPFQDDRYSDSGNEIGVDEEEVIPRPSIPSRKRNSIKTGKPVQKQWNDEDEEITSDSGSDMEEETKDVVEDEKEDVELADEKRIRLAKAYIEDLKQRNEQKKLDGFDAAELDRDLIAKRLKEDTLESKGILFRSIAKSYKPSPTSLLNLDFKKFPKAHHLSLTCVIACPKHRWVFTGSKDGSIAKWDIDLRRKLGFLPGLSRKKQSDRKGHFDAVTSLVIFQSYLISASEDTYIHVWDLKTLAHVHSFHGHRGKVTGLACNGKEPILYSVSEDKSVKLWHLDDLIYIETLFGHQEAITCIDSSIKETCVTVGGRDNTVRFWKIVEQSQLIFRSPHAGSIDVVYQPDTAWFVSGNDRGELALWHLSKKKPLHTFANAHQGWIVSLAGIPGTDLFFSGSMDGHLNLWRLQRSPARICLLAAFPIPGCINAIHVTPPAFFPNYDVLFQHSDAPTSTDLKVYIALGQEHKWGRWWKIKEAKNSLVELTLKAHLEESEKKEEPEQTPSMP